MYYYVFAILLGLMWLMWRITTSTFGLGLRAIRENEQKARYLGVNVQRSRLIAFVIAAAYGAVGGVIVGIPVGLADPSLAYWVQSGNLVFMLLLGGYTNFFGPVVGSRCVHFLSRSINVPYGILASDLRGPACRHSDLFSEWPHGGYRSAATVVDVTILQAADVRKLYGTFCALNGVSLRIGDGEHVSIIGPNGAGKTTLINVLTGLVPPTAGMVTFKGADMSRLDPLRLSRLGMARSFQLVNIFPHLSVRETIAVAAISHLGMGERLLLGLRKNRASGRSSSALPICSDL